MYYSAVVQQGCKASKEVVRTAGAFNIELKTFLPNSFQGSQMLDIAKEEPDFTMPVVMMGDEVLAMGEQAWLLMYEHSLANPHVHWEASDSEGDDT